MISIVSGTKLHAECTVRESSFCQASEMRVQPTSESRLPCQVVLHLHHLVGVCLLQVADGISAVFGGASFDVLNLSVRQVSGIMTVVGGVCCLVWTLYAWWQCRKLSLVKEISTSDAVQQAA